MNPRRKNALINLYNKVRGRDYLEGLNKLWDYQVAELAVEEYENRLKNTETRKRLVQLQKFLQGSQAKLIESEKNAIVRQDRISNLEAQLKQYSGELEDLGKDLSYYSECDITEVNPNDIQELVKNCEKVNESIAAIKKSITKIKNDNDAIDKETRSTLQKMRKAKKDFDELKEAHVKELEAGSQDLDKLRKAMFSAQKEVPAELMQSYRAIKGIRQNPVAILENSRCGGCNMQLPSGITQTVKNSDHIIECENCGRILYIPEK